MQQFGGLMTDQKKEKPKIDGYYQAQAKNVVDCLFDKGFLREDVSRDDMNAIEDLIGFLFQSHCDMAAKAALLTKKAKER